MIQKIFSLDKAIRLKEMGNQILYDEPNKKYPQYKVFCFIKDEKFINDWNKIKNK